MPSQADIGVVREALKSPRPGFEAQRCMMPRPRASSESDEPAREGGVLLLLYPVEGRLHLVLTRRTEQLPSHKGQISLPGGTRHAGETFEETALREAWEELDLPPSQVEVLGQLSPLHIPPSNYCIRPIVGYTPTQPAFQRDPREVAEILEIPLAKLLAPSTLQEEDWELRGEIVRVPFFAVNEYKVWGATAMVLAEFLELIRTQIA